MPIGPSRSLYGAIVVAAVSLVPGTSFMRQALAQPSETLDGWRRSPPPPAGWQVDDVRRGWRNPGLRVSWREFPLTPELLAKGPVREFEFDFDNAGILFKRSQGLELIALTADRQISLQACEDTHRKLLSAIEPQYGALEARERNAKFTSFPTTRNAIHEIAGAKSQYLYSTGTRNTPGTYWVIMSASRAFSERYIEVITIYDNTSCSIRVMFDDEANGGSTRPRNPT